MAIYLLDTNIVSLSINPKASIKLRERLERVIDVSAVSSTVWCELYWGAWRLPRGNRRSMVEDHLRRLVYDHVEVLPYDRVAAEWHAAERARLASIGLTPPFADGQIAAVAAVNDLTLVTQNAGDFADFAGLRVEGW